MLPIRDAQQDLVTVAVLWTAGAHPVLIAIPWPRVSIPPSNRTVLGGRQDVRNDVDRRFELNFVTKIITAAQALGECGRGLALRLTLATGLQTPPAFFRVVRHLQRSLPDESSHAKPPHACMHLLAPVYCLG